MLQRKVLVDEKAEEPFEYVDVETPKGAILLDMDNSHEFLLSEDVPIEAWKYVDNDLVLDEEKRQRLIDEYDQEQNKMTKEEINEMAILELAGIISEMKGGF